MFRKRRCGWSDLLVFVAFLMLLASIALPWEVEMRPMRVLNPVAWPPFVYIPDRTLVGFDILELAGDDIYWSLKRGNASSAIASTHIPYFLSASLLPFMFLAWVRWRYGIFVFVTMLALMLSNWGFYHNWPTFHTHPGAWVWSASFVLMLFAAGIGWRNTRLIDEPG